MLKRTALFDTHRALGARLVEFGGWEMPLQYEGITAEHVHTRAAASIFDVSHMGRLIFRGAKADEFVDRTLTRNCAKLAVGRCGYAHVCNEKGGILDDVIISRAADYWYMVCNASNRPKVLDHLRPVAAGLRVEIDDQTEQTVMLAIQGPRTLELFKNHVPIKLPELKRYAFTAGSSFGLGYHVFRTGYTGEDGLEVVLPAASGATAWEFVTQPGDDGKPVVRPAGLGARDTLRLEAGMPLYGHELGEETDSISASCGWAVDLSKDFIGAAALRRIAAEGPTRKLVGLSLEGRRIARQGAAVMKAGQLVGTVTSGTFGPTVQKSIAMAFVDTPLAQPGEMLEVDLRGETVTAIVGPLAAYQRTST